MNSALQQGKSYICSALLKHGNCSFSLEILEYCEPEKCLIREKHYLDLLEPEYNLSLDPTASFAGRKHSEKSKTIMSDAKKGIQLTEETKRIMSGVRKGKTHSEETKKKNLTFYA
jgi:group I intron endonuclease